jgi:hypothetical protein
MVLSGLKVVACFQNSIKQEKKVTSISPKTLPFYYNFQNFVLASMLKIQHSLNVCPKMYVWGKKSF